MNVYRKLYSKAIFSIASIVWLLASCQLEDTPPILEEPMINLQSENIVVEAPTEMRFDGLFSDEEASDSLEIIIGPQFSTSPNGVVTNRSPFYYSEKLDIGGQSTAVTKFITLEDSVAEGEYLLTAGFQDVSGNAGDSVRLPFQMVNIGPLISINVNQDTSFMIQQSDSLVVLSGQVLYQNEELSKVSFTLEGKRFITIETFSREDSTLFSNNLPFNINFELPSDLDTGSYMFKVNALDTVNSSTTLEVPFIVQ